MSIAPHARLLRFFAVVASAPFIMLILGTSSYAYTEHETMYCRLQCQGSPDPDGCISSCLSTSAGPPPQYNPNSSPPDAPGSFGSSGSGSSGPDSSSSSDDPQPGGPGDTSGQSGGGYAPGTDAQQKRY
jgi:hypothetical protein